MEKFDVLKKMDEQHNRLMQNVAVYIWVALNNWLFMSDLTVYTLTHEDEVVWP